MTPENVELLEELIAAAEKDETTPEEVGEILYDATMISLPFSSREERRSDGEKRVTASNKIRKWLGDAKGFKLLELERQALRS